MAFIVLKKGSPQGLEVFMKGRGILVWGDRNPIRLVTHLDVNREDVEALVRGVREYFRSL